MPVIAVIEDDPPTSDSFVQWLSKGIAGADVRKFEDPESAATALNSAKFDLVVLDIALGIKRHAGIELLNLINHLSQPPPVLVVSGLPPEHYRGVTKALGAWDFLQKPCEAHDLVATAAEILSSPGAGSQVDGGDLVIGPLNQVRWKSNKVSITLTGVRILTLLFSKRGTAVHYAELFDAVPTGKNEENVRKHISTIRAAFKEVDPSFSQIKVVPVVGFMWLKHNP